MTKSQNNTPVSPYPMQGPFTAAMVGLNSSMPLSNELMVGFSQKVPPKVPTAPALSVRSAPAQNTSPAPVRMPTHASSSSRKRSQAALRSRRIAPLIALRDSGRLRVMVATWSTTS